VHIRNDRRPDGRRAVLAAVVTALTASLLVGGSAGVATPAEPAPSTTPPERRAALPDPRPNVVVILTDDQRRDTLSHMPQVQRLLVQQGMTYRQAMVPTSLCCPSRSTILTGLYAHSSRVYGNGDVGGARLGGWRRFHRTGMEKRTMGVAFRRAGYRTAMIGKYLNYFGKAKPGYVPPGWDRFSTLLSKHGAYYAYWLNDGTYHGITPQDYSTDVFAHQAAEFVRSTPAEQPLFLFFSPYGPHAPYKPAPRHDGALEGKLSRYVAPTLKQKLRTMPKWMRERVHVTQTEVDYTRQKQLESLLSVDDAVASVHQALSETGRADNTLFVFLSDNGYFWGEHRIIGKDAPYQDATRIPMVVRWDGHVPAGVTSGRIVLNVDVARTVTDAAGVSMRTDGLDMLGRKKRKGFVLEAMNGYHERPAYCGWRTKHRMYVRWATGEQELFDYRSDPNERRNLAHRRKWADVRKKMRAKARQHCTPEPPHYDW
jgi:arylsulfatase A-like enzyme